jgi:peptidoglycan hydrolase CwlO-like protein
MKKTFSTAILLLFIIYSFSQDNVKAFTLKEAVDYALDNNNSVRNAKLDEQKAKAFNWEILTQF